ncbi:S41 family peptidase [Desulfofundulus salinus]|uniref:Peptidase S41 n=1 Tax=Desulfofundulus salinus TaxID=2419843 RepID=A0A494WYN8_9FIRM|nr:S41 family peptidase [Desulfofundulus salinum]RKO66007.1 peptidase S41 [Desulfofundulus salinum]
MQIRIILLVMALLFFLPVFPAGAGDDLERAAATVSEVMDYVYHYHIARPGVDQLVDGAINGLLSRLGDPYTEYFTAEDLDNFTNSLEGNFAGIGVELEGWPPYPQVARVLRDSPAYRAGIREKDLIIRVNGEDTAGLTLSQVVERIRGPAGSRVQLTIRRGGVPDFNVELVREKVSSSTVEWEVLPGNIGYVRVHFFSSRTVEEFGILMQEFRARGIKGMILDLRNDPGGYLQAAVDLAGYFLPAGQVVVTTVDRNDQKEVYYTAGKTPALDLPLVVLVNNMSASSAEVLAGALQDYRRAVLVGDRTYGKGVVQAIIPLETGGALKLTIARYLTPGGRSIDGRGVEPDRWVSTPSLQLVAARQELQPRSPRTVLFNLSGTGVFVNGEKISDHLSPLIQAGETCVPLRFTLEALGFSVHWQHEGHKVLARAGDRELILDVGMKTAIIGGQKLGLGSLMIRGGSIYLPVSLFSRLGVKVEREGEQLKLELLPVKQE